MANLFAGLENLGIKIDKGIQVFEEEKKDPKKGQAAEKQQVKEIVEEDLIFDKTYECPVCGTSFKSKMVRTGKAKLIGADTDLRPRYQVVDPLKYDAILCPHCGYASLNRYFNFVMSGQIKLIREQISAGFNYEEPENVKIYSYDEAITRHKLALLNTVVKKGKTSERAYTCLKLAWLNRGKAEEMKKEKKPEEEIKAIQEEEMQFLQNAYEGFNTAFSRETFPMCGMDIYTVTYIVAELARRIGKIEDAKKWVSKVLVARDAGRRVKEKALELKEMLKEDSE